MRLYAFIAATCFAAGTASPAFAQQEPDACERILDVSPLWNVETSITGVTVSSRPGTVSLTAVDGIEPSGEYIIGILASPEESIFRLHAGSIRNQAGEDSPLEFWDIIALAVFHGEDEIFRMSAKPITIYQASREEYEILQAAAATNSADFHFDFLKPDGKGPFLRLRVPAQAMADGFAARADALSWLEAGCPAE